MIGPPINPSWPARACFLTSVWQNARTRTSEIPHVNEFWSHFHQKVARHGSGTRPGIGFPSPTDSSDPLTVLVQTAADSLLGNREENQDRLTVLRRSNTLLAAVVDGMGGHHGGAMAAQAAIDTFHEAFNSLPLPVTAPGDVLSDLVQKAHEAVVALGANKSIDLAPRATCVVALIQENQVTWAHIGDSRVYLLRNADVVERTRDHSHVEILLREGLITEDEYREHPLRNYVESCLGGEPEMATLAVSDTHELRVDDMVLLCSDGVWSGADDREIAFLLTKPETRDNPKSELSRLLKHAVAMCEPHADNTTAALIHWQGLAKSAATGDG